MQCESAAPAGQNFSGRRCARTTTATRARSSSSVATMKGKRRRSRSRTSQAPKGTQKQRLPQAAQIVAFTEAEEAFFLAGAQQAEPSAAESFDDLDVGYQRP